MTINIYRLFLSLDTFGRQHSNNSEIFYHSDFVSFATAHSPQPELLFSYIIALGQASHAPQPDSTTQDGVASASASCFEVLPHKSHKAQYGPMQLMQMKGTYMMLQAMKSYAPRRVRRWPKSETSTFMFKNCLSG